MEFFATWFDSSWDMVAESAPWLLVGCLIGGVIHTVVPVPRIARSLGAPGWRGVVAASLIGIPLPLCSCSVIPVATSLRKRGAGKGATAGFLISTPETGVDSIAISYGLLGPFMTIARPVAALITAVVAGLLIEWFDNEPTDTSRVPSPPDGCDGDSSWSSCCGTNGRPPRSTPIVAACLRFVIIDMFADLAHWLMIGFALGGLISAWWPAGSLIEYVGHGLGPMFLMLVIGLPMYVCATASTPLAAGLIAAGLSPGAALVFLLAGPATNIGTILIVARDLGRRSAVIYVLTIATVAMLCGAAVNAMAAAVTAITIAEKTSHETPGIVAKYAGVLLVLLMLNGMRIRFRNLGRHDGGPTSATISPPGRRLGSAQPREHA